ncbi:hypothetical protein OH492_10575 [Vibrio chagasii]|nr:hypothetical protein [Vibrio chagasii]
MGSCTYIEVGGVIWPGIPDGTWQLLPATQAKVDGVQVVLNLKTWTRLNL